MRLTLLTATYESKILDGWLPSVRIDAHLAYAASSLVWSDIKVSISVSVYDELFLRLQRSLSESYSQ